MKNSLARFVSYFSWPFPRAKGFSAYRMPGVAVHVPVIILSVALGALLCVGNGLRPALVAIYILVGVYVGRDLAILAHYNGLITLGVWLCFLTLVFAPQRVNGWAQAVTSFSPLLPLLVTLAVFAAFLMHVASWSSRTLGGAAR